MRLKELTALSGVSGREDEVREYLLRELKYIADEVYTDRAGNVIAVKHGTDADPKRIMLDAHMDEVGFMVVGITDDGLLKFAPVGGIDKRICPSMRVLVGKKKLPGVIGSVAVHLLTPEQRKHPQEMQELAIDIGCTTREEAEALVELGDWAIFDSDYVEFGDGMIKARCLDDRVGCSLIMDVLQDRYPVTVYGVFSVQEEMGGHGAAAAAYALKPDAAIVLEGTTCADMHGVEPHKQITTIGRGAAISIMDSSAIPEYSLRRFLKDTAKKNDIPVQDRRGSVGGTNAGKIQRTCAGVVVANVNVPTRYIHSPYTVISKKDYNSALDLLRAAVRGLQDFLSDEEE